MGAQATSKAKLAAAEARLGEVGIRLTAPRRLVLRTLSREPDDATAQEIHGRLRTSGNRVGLATVYRTLTLLQDCGAVDALSHRPGESCYRLCAPGHHHHLVCSDCHRVQELTDCTLDDWLAAVGEKHGFRPTSHSLEVVGVCSACAVH
jgi:Fur family transcriptional regulator, ferric uptake regulator